MSSIRKISKMNSVTKMSSFVFKISLHLKLSQCHLSTLQQAKSFQQVPQTPRKNFIQRLKKIKRKFESRAQIDVNYERDGYFDILHKRYGKIVKDGETNIVHLFDPKDVEILFKNETRVPTRLALEPILVAKARTRDIAPKFSAMFNQGNEWYTLRNKTSNYLFSPQTMLNVCPALDRNVMDFVNKVSATKNKDNDCVEHLYEKLCSLAFQNAGSLLFGKSLAKLNFDQSDCTRFVAALEDMLIASSKLELSFRWYKWFSTPTYKVVERSYKTISQISLKHMHRNIETIRNKPQSDPRGSFLAHLLSRKDVDDDDIFSIVTDTYMGGTDTTGGSTSMLLYHLAKNPNKQQKLFEEIQQLFPNPKESITIGQLQSLSYLKACINESHRLTPIVDFTSRTLQKDQVFSGYNIPSGIRVIVHHRLMGKIYFTDSSKFEPERWLNANDRPIAFSWLPFGHGVRNCPGQKIAQLQALLLTFRVMQRYKLSYDGEDYVTTTSILVNKPSKDLRIRFIDRNI